MILQNRFCIVLVEKDALSLLHQAKKDYEHSLVAYNNFGVVLLSIPSVASSTIVAIATKRGSRRVEVAIVVMEAIVVSFFLIIFTYALVVFLPADDTFVFQDIRESTRQTSIQKYGRIEVSGLHRERIIYISKTSNGPKLLIFAEIYAIFARMVVIGNLIIWKRAIQAYDDDEDKLIVELWANEDGKQYSHDSC